jgi:uncharacterized protein (TIGR02646 family)
MIHIDRCPAQPPFKVYTLQKRNRDGSILTKAEYEKLRAIHFFSDPHNYKDDKKLTKKVFPFEVYKDEDVVAALEACFHNKCAYCESQFAHVTPTDVEHFRPKSEIIDNQQSYKPGYYWLAGDWENLLASCADCNRSRKLEIPGEPEKFTLGKLAQFPLRPGAQHVRSPNEALSQEEPARLLLNPCQDEPELHLRYDDEGLIYAREDSQGQKSEMGAASITVYALERKFLVEARKKVLLDFKLKIDLLTSRVEDQPSRLKAGVQADIQSNLEDIRKLSLSLMAMLERTAPYQGLLRDTIRRGKQAGEWRSLEEFGIDLGRLI